MKIEIKNRYSDEVITIQEVGDNEQNPLVAAVAQAVRAGVNLKFADLSDAGLESANLRGDVNTLMVKSIHQRVYEAASWPGALNMDDWHTCEPPHSLARWAEVLAGVRDIGHGGHDLPQKRPENGADAGFPLL